MLRPDPCAFEYSYDNNNQLSLISIPGQGLMTYNKYNWFMPATITLPGGTRKENTYTPLTQLKSLAVKDPAQNSLMSYDYAYSPAGNITAKNTENGNYTYQYDELYRLIGATNGSNEAYTYDAAGNRLSSADVQGDWSYDQNNQLTGYDGVSYEYDNNGNIVTKTDQKGTATYTYDVDNRLVQIRNPQSAIYSYYYDPFGRRLWKEVNGVKTYFFYSDEGLIGEYNATGLEIKTYGYAPNSTWTTNPLFQKIGTNYYWYQTDHLGTPQKIVDASGRVVWTATYDSFGNIQIQISEIENNLRFPGQYFDQETGLHYNWNRYYDTMTGRYLTQDPIGNEEGKNHLYTYVGGDPINHMDAFGLFKCGTRNYKAKPDNATIVCDGAGGIKVQLGWCAKKGKCLRKCCTVHETTHKNDCDNKNVCAGKPAGTQVYISNIRDLWKSECNAYKADLQCTNSSLNSKECCKEKNDLKANKSDDERNIKIYCRGQGK